MAAGLLFTAGLLASGYQATAQAPVKQWDKRFGGSGTDFLRALQPTSDGGSILGGFSYSPASGDKTEPAWGAADYWVVKLDASGTKQWDRRFGGSGNDFLFGMQPTPDGGYLLAGSSLSPASGDKTEPSRGLDDYWIVKLDANGTKQWDRRFGGNDQEHLRVLRPTSDGGYILAGYSDSPAGPDKTESSRGQFDFWVVKINASGTKQWDKTLGGSGVDFLHALQPTSDGGYVLGGFSNSPASGDKTESSRGGYDYWVIKLDANGAKQWDKTLGGSGNEELGALQPTSDGGYLLGGMSQSPASGDKTEVSRGRDDYWVVKLDASGSRQWDKALGGSQDDFLTSLQPTSDGGYLLGGLSDSPVSGDKTEPSQGGYDYWLVKLAPSGTKQWDKRFGGSGEDYLTALQPSRDGGYLLAGSSRSPLSGDKTEAGRGGDDYWVVKLAPLGPTATAPAVARQALDVYPNPARQRLTLRLPVDAPRTNLRLLLLDATGRAVHQQALTPAGPEVAVSVGPQPAGLYLLRLEGPRGYVVTQRVELK